MRIECTESRISTTDPESGQHYVLTRGDCVTVPDAFGRFLCDRGWARDTAGQYATGPRDPRAAQLAPAAVALTPTAEG